MHMETYKHDDTIAPKEVNRYNICLIILQHPPVLATYLGAKQTYNRLPDIHDLIS